jgi:hypothetical protein
MKRGGLMLLLLVTVGCSTAPWADFLDIFRPGRVRDENAPPYGGVCQPKQAVPPAAPTVPTAPAAPAPLFPAPPPQPTPTPSTPPPPLAPTPSAPSAPAPAPPP